MSRSIFNDFKNEFGSSFEIFSSSFSGALTAVSIGAGFKLRVYNFRVSGPAVLADTSGAQLETAEHGVFGTVFLNAGGEREVKLDPKYIETSGGGLTVSRPGGLNHELNVEIWYRTVSDV